VVMDAARKLAEGGQPLPDPATLARDAGLAWLRAQAQRGGFRIVEAPVESIGEDGLIEAEPASRAAVRVEGYRQHRIVRRGATPIRFSTLDFEGLLEVSDPPAFLAKVAAGFGPQKAFGCGLMLLRRA
jgi:CRISPR system Cascade subunit CasE